jgi:hypothetical protein
MCYIHDEVCRFCSNTKDVVERCGAAMRKIECAQSKILKGAPMLQRDSTRPTTWARKKLPIRETRVFCKNCMSLSRHIIDLVPHHEAAKDLDTRPAFEFEGVYYCPGFLDAIYTAATEGIDELNMRYATYRPVKEWRPEKTDYYKKKDSKAVQPAGKVNHAMKLIGGQPPVELREALLAQGETGSEELHRISKLSMRLASKMTLLQNMKKELDSIELNDYQVVCSPHLAPVEHVESALKVAVGGIGGTRLTIDMIAERIEECDRRWFNGGNFYTEEENGSAPAAWFGWVDEALHVRLQRKRIAGEEVWEPFSAKAKAGKTWRPE